jgi:hypothetical protein
VAKRPLFDFFRVAAQLFQSNYIIGQHDSSGLIGWRRSTTGDFEDQLLEEVLVFKLPRDETPDTIGKTLDQFGLQPQDRIADRQPDGFFACLFRLARFRTGTLNNLVRVAARLVQTLFGATASLLQQFIGLTPTCRNSLLAQAFNQLFNA